MSLSGRELLSGHRECVGARGRSSLLSRRSAVLEHGVRACQRHCTGERPVTLGPPHLLICPGPCALTLLFSLCIRLKLGFSILKRTTKTSLVRICLGLTTGMSGNCQLLFIKAQALAKDTCSGELVLPPLLPLLLLYALICPEFTFIALSPIPCFTQGSSLHLVNTYLCYGQSFSALVTSALTDALF